MKRQIVGYWAKHKKYADPTGLFYRAARVPEGREEVENGGEGSRALCLSQSGSEPLPNPMLTQSAAEVSLVGSELVTGWLAWFPMLRKFTSTLVLSKIQGFSIPIA